MQVVYVDSQRTYDEQRYSEIATYSENATLAGYKPHTALMRLTLVQPRSYGEQVRYMIRAYIHICTGS